MHVLLALANADGKVLSRDEIILQVWGVEFATDDLLSRAISDLRKALGDDPKAPSFIETIPTVGYRLIAPIGPREPTGEFRVRTPRSRSRVGLVWVAGAALLLLSVAGAETIISSGAKPPPQPRPLLSAPGIEVTPEFSPDGQRIVYTWHGPDRAKHDVFVIAVGTPDTPERVAEGPAFSPTWSPDGARIAFVRHSIESGECSIRIVELAGGPDTELTQCTGTVQKLRWAPDGTWLIAAITPERGAATALFRISLNGHGTTQLTIPPDSTAGDDFPAFSPDGRFLAFARWTRTESAKLVTLDLESEDLRCLGPDDADIHGVDWAPHGRSILFAARLGSRNGIWEMPRGGGEPAWVVGGELAPHMLDVDPTSGALAYTAIVRERNIWRYAVERDSRALTDPTQLVSSTRVDYRPRLSPDGDQLAFVSNRTGQFELWLSDADGNDAVQLTTLGAHRIGPLQWSHDGSRIAFSAERGVNRDVHVLEVATRRVIRRTTHPAGDQLPSWSADDRWIYFGSERSGDWEIWRMPADSGTASPLARTGGYGAVEGPDGQLYFTKWGVDGLWRMRPSELDAELVVDSMPHTPPGNWVLDDGGVIFAAQATAEMQMHLVRHDFAGDVAQTLAVIGVDPWRTTGLDLSPDGRFLYFTQLDRLEGDLMIVDPR
jgi:Tol biopolymer transport system component